MYRTELPKCLSALPARATTSLARPIVLLVSGHADRLDVARADAKAGDCRPQSDALGAGPTGEGCILKVCSWDEDFRETQNVGAHPEVRIGC